MRPLRHNQHVLVTLPDGECERGWAKIDRRYDGSKLVIGPQWRAYASPGYPATLLLILTPAGEGIVWKRGWGGAAALRAAFMLVRSALFPEP